MAPPNMVTIAARFPANDYHELVDALRIVADFRRLGLTPPGYRLTSPHGSGRWEKRGVEGEEASDG